MRLAGTLAAIGLLAWIATGCASTGDAGDNPNQELNLRLAQSPRPWDVAPEYVVEPPDRLLVTVKDNPDLMTEAVVRPDGRFTMSLIGDVYVAGKTAAAIEEEVERLLGRYLRTPNATVAVTGFESKHVFVYGEVQRPGEYPYTGRDTVVSAIARAGTLNWRAAPNGVQVTRGDPNNPTILPVRLKDIVIDDDDVTNYFLRPNDIVWVPPSTMVKVGDIVRDILWPLSFVTAPISAWAGYEAVRD